MSRLLSANIMRLRKNKSFWSGLIFMFGMGILFPVKSYIDTIQTGWVYNIDDCFYACAVLICIVMAEFCSMFIGTEYSDGTIRNKIIVGQERTAVYLANVITSAAVGVAMLAAFALPYLCLGIPLLGFFAADIEVVLLVGLAVLLLAAAFSSIYTLAVMACQNKATAAVICILLAFGLLIAGAVLNTMLEAPETIHGYSLGEDGNLIYSEERNPKYLEGTKRDIVQAVYDILPGGQAVQCAMVAAVNLPRLPFYSLAVILLATGMGVALFRKRDLK